MYRFYLKAITAIAALLFTMPVYGTGKRLKSFSTTREHYVAVMNYDSHSRVTRIDVRGLPGDPEGQGIDQTLSIDWNNLDNKVITMSREGSGPFNYDESVELSADGKIIACTEYGSSYSSSPDTYTYDSDGYCIQKNYGDYGSHFYGKFIYSWENGDIVKIVCEEYWEGEGSITESNATYNNETYPQGAEFVGGWMDNECIDAEFPWLAIFTGMIKSSRHHMVSSEPMKGIIYGYNYEVDEDGYPLQISGTYWDGPVTYRFEWEESAGITDCTVSTTDEHDSYFSLEGIQLDRPVKGINIVRHSDGSSAKIIIR